MISIFKTKNNDPEELEVIKIVKEVCQKYDIPSFTQTILVEKGAVPHSHPVLTINTRTKEPRSLLKVLVHEQLHWYAQEHESYNDCIDYLKLKYKEDGEHNKSGTYPNSYWEHIIVCFNTRMYLSKYLSKKDLEWIYQQWQAYPTIERLIVDEEKEIYNDLVKFNFILLK